MVRSCYVMLCPRGLAADSVSLDVHARGLRVTGLAPVAAEAAALKRGIEVGARVAAMMAQRGSDGRTERERRERRGDG